MSEVDDVMREAFGFGEPVKAAYTLPLSYTLQTFRGRLFLRGPGAPRKPYTPKVARAWLAANKAVSSDLRRSMKEGDTLTVVWPAGLYSIADVQARPEAGSVVGDFYPRGDNALQPGEAEGSHGYDWAVRRVAMIEGQPFAGQRPT